MSSTSISYSESSRINRLFHQAIELNNAGVDFFKLGQYESAIQYLYGALNGMQRFSMFKEQADQSCFEHHQIITESMTVSRHSDAGNSNSTSTSLEPTTGPYGQRSALTLQDEQPSIRGGDDTDTDTSNANANANGNNDNNDCSSPPLFLSTVASFDKESESSDCGPGCTNCTDNTNSGEEGSNNSNSNNSNSIRVRTAIDITAIYRCAVNLACYGDCAEAITNPAFSCSKKDAARIRASILFNLGLAHHMIAGLASSTTNNSTTARLDSNTADADAAIARMLEKAKAIYQLSLNLQESEQAPISTNYVMALCNNIGQCYDGLHQTSESITWIERLLRLLVCQQQQQKQQQHQHQHQQCEHASQNELFVRNTTCLILRDPHTAPSA